MKFIFQFINFKGVFIWKQQVQSFFYVFQSNSRMVFACVFFGWLPKAVYARKCYRVVFCLHRNIDKRFFAVADAVLKGIFNKRNEK